MGRLIRIFNKIDESMAAELPVPETPLALLQRLFVVPENNPMFESFRIEERHIDVLSAQWGITFDLAAHEYFLEFDSD